MTGMHNETVECTKEISVPDGWKLTGEYRLPRTDENILYEDRGGNAVSRASFNYNSNKHYILEEDPQTHTEVFIQAVQVPDGWKLTGEYRAAKGTESYIGLDGKACSDGPTCGEYHIIERGDVCPQMQMLHEHLILPLHEGKVILSTLEAYVTQEPPAPCDFDSFREPPVTRVILNLKATPGC